MEYLVNASIGGKLAQVGSAVDAASGAMADRFFGTSLRTLRTAIRLEAAPQYAGQDSSRRCRRS
jgi:hypothetical protein